MSLEIVIGPMFSGKSSYALSYIRRHRAVGKEVLIIKPDIDNRYTRENLLMTHDKDHVPCVLWHSGKRLEITEDMCCASCIVFEEAQFFEKLVGFIKELVFGFKKNVLIVGLDGDAKQQPFGEILQCIPLATKVTKLCSLCQLCKDGTPAPFTKRKDYSTTEQIVVGGPERYEAVCLKHLTYIQ